MTPAHRALRAATAAAHARVDTVFAGFDLSDRASYAAFLSAHAAALGPVEAMLDAAGAERVAPDWPERRRGALIAADLAELGVAPAAETTAAALGDDDATLAGALYVVEGSRLGGRLLARSVGAGLPRRYLAADQRPGNWPKMLARIDAVLYDAERTNRAVAAALAVFAAFETAGLHGLSKV